MSIHVHVINGDGKAKINVHPEIELVSNNGIKPKDLKKALVITEACQDDIIDVWRKYHGE